MDGNFWYSPFLSINFFANGKFLKHSTEGFSYESFRQYETKNFRRKILIFPLLIPKVFGCRKLFGTQHRRVPWWNASVQIDTIIATENLDTPPPPPSHLNFFGTRKWWKTKGFAYGICQHCETKIFRKKSWCFPLPLLQKLFHNQKISETQHREVRLRNASVLWDKKFATKNRDITVLSIKSSDTQFSDKLRCCPTIFFGNMRQKTFEGKSWHFPLPLIQKLFRYQKFSEAQHRRVTLRKVLVLWDKMFSTENLDITLKSIIFFDGRN